jgi:hypothetical protein
VNEADSSADKQFTAISGEDEAVEAADEEQPGDGRDENVPEQQGANAFGNVGFDANQYSAMNFSGDFNQMQMMMAMQNGMMPGYFNMMGMYTWQAGRTALANIDIKVWIP